MPASQGDPGQLWLDDTIDSVVASYRDAVATSNAILDEHHDVEALCMRGLTTREPLSLCWVLIHMVEETARRAGHADILREEIDGLTGR